MNRSTRIGRFVLFGVVMFLSSCQYSVVQAQSIEITERFREVAKKLVKQQFKNIVFNELQDNDPVLAASTYDLINRAISGDSLPEIKKQIIVSTFDYLEFLHLRNYLKGSFPVDSISRVDGKKVTLEDYAKLMNLSSLLVYEYLATRDLLVISEGVAKILIKYSDFYTEFRPLPGDSTSTAVNFAGSVADFMGRHDKDILRSIRLSVLLKNIVVSLAVRDSLPANLKENYELLFKVHFATQKEFLNTVQDTVKKSLLGLRAELDASVGKKYADLFVIVAPYVNQMIFQKIEQQPIDYSRQLLIVFLEKMESIYDENKSGIKYKLGLWAGCFVGGTAWDPPTTSYPVLSFRINDRLQYTFADSCCGEWFLYLGGFSDILIKELTNKTSNQFGYAGIGVTTKSISFAASATIPVNRDATKIGFVLSIMYDLPLEELLK